MKTWRWIWGCVGLAMAAGATAQTEKVVLSKAQRLECLSRPAASPRFPPSDEADDRGGSMRVLMKFDRPDAPPQVQVLFNVASEGMQDKVLDHVARYRLPCLQADDGTVTAVQDFVFDGSDKDPLAVPDAERSVSTLRCLVMPRYDFQYSGDSGRFRSEKVRAEMTFSGAGDQPPEVQLSFSRASRRFEQAVKDRVAAYRMPCRTAQDKPVTIQQQFAFFPAGKEFKLSRTRFGLMEFLGQTEEPGKLTARFDLRSMGCPFSVQYVFGGGAVPNEASVLPIGERLDPNKLAFLKWLEGLKFNFGSREVADDLFGSSLQIDVPCGLLHLGEAPPAPR
ncbi:hypothetical protein [Roseateles puraquae]|nr:hypothetical protein [Roseateles puraquae]MDG0853957.1 hypothetical protein [Roseateles puraquae]